MLCDDSYLEPAPAWGWDAGGRGGDVCAVVQTLRLTVW